MATLRIDLSHWRDDPGPGDGDEDTMDREWMEILLRTVVDQTRGIDRGPSQSQRLMDELAAACLEEGEIEVGAAVCLVQALRCYGPEAIPPAAVVLAGMIHSLQEIDGEDV